MITYNYLNFLSDTGITFMACFVLFLCFFGLFFFFSPFNFSLFLI